MTLPVGWGAPSVWNPQAAETANAWQKQDSQWGSWVRTGDCISLSDCISTPGLPEHNRNVSPQSSGGQKPKFKVPTGPYSLLRLYGRILLFLVQLPGAPAIPGLWQYCSSLYLRLLSPSPLCHFFLFCLFIRILTWIKGPLGNAS